ELYAPQTALEKFDVEGHPVISGDEINGIQVLESDCWGAEESVSYFYKGILHTGDSAAYPTAEGVKVIFSACFPDYYDEYLSESKRLAPELVIPFHYDPAEELEDAQGLVEQLKNAGIHSRILGIGESIEV
nr:MBL fold metallo-hydrolase [Candidatus Korarchaeota archaeon]NIU83628.1 MBL fold metallo-hydrolase [Candidatus Thorarchaeota archaeon]NIW13855.1 MBL fold metallo-hydrolase [Candidatus Thorarchaeota archaeon]NIW51966.1 MBL fold metallo-hydrolase [Candidatus Korarchaeota archaeon]